MVRTLPWLKGTTAVTSSKAASSASRAGSGNEGGKEISARMSLKSQPRHAAASGHGDDLSSASRGGSEKAAGSDESRATSPATPPPAEELMIDGIENDDGYRMVEDELLGMAQTFTKNLHQAEYDRMMSRIRMEGGGRIRPLPGDSHEGIVDLGTPGGVARRGAKMTTTDADTAVVDEETVSCSTSLNKLLVKPSTKARPLAAVQPHQYTTKQSPRKQKSQFPAKGLQRRKMTTSSFGSDPILDRGTRPTRSEPTATIHVEESDSEDDLTMEIKTHAVQIPPVDDDDDLGPSLDSMDTTNLSQNKSTFSRNQDHSRPSSDDDDDDLDFCPQQSRTIIPKPQLVTPPSAEIIDQQAAPNRNRSLSGEGISNSVSSEPTRGVVGGSRATEPIRRLTRIRRPATAAHILDELWDDFDNMDSKLKREGS